MITREKFFREIKGKEVTFCGIARTNMPLIRMFANYGAIVSARDRREFTQLGENGEILKKMGIKLHLGENYMENLYEGIIFRTPAMRFFLPELSEAREKGLVVTSEMEIFFSICPCKVVAVTGSDGKTTTTAIIAELLKRQGKKVHLGGNIGNPLLPKIFEISADDVAVVELSSFQLISMKNNVNTAVITNISPNHLDVHKDMEEYIDAKKNVFLHQDAFSRTVLNADNSITSKFSKEVRGDVWEFSRRRQVKRGAFFDGSSIFINGKKIIGSSDIKIPGIHNIENYMAAICAVYDEVDIRSIRRVAMSFEGVEHRIELVKEIDGVKYYNDSIATSPSRTMQGALSLSDEKIILIAGGYDKNIPYDDLGRAVNNKVKTLILMGATAEKIEASVRAADNFLEDISIFRAGTMEDAVRRAAEQARSGDKVILSPASASFDMYADFAARGEHFKNLVNAL